MWLTTIFRKTAGNVHRLTWNTIMEAWMMTFLFNWVIFRFHDNFQGCNGVIWAHFEKCVLVKMDWFIFSIFWDLDFVNKDSWSLTTYCWWKTSHTTWDVSNPMNPGTIQINWCRISSINSREVLDCEKVRSNNKSRWIVCLGGFLLAL